MVYKSKRINRKSYIKRQSRKRMYGGATGEVISSPSVITQYNQPPPPKPIPDKKQPIPTPTLNDNLEDAGEVAADIGNMAVAAGIEGVQNLTGSVAEGLGIDPNKTASEAVQDLTDSVKNLNNVLNSQQGEELKEQISEVATDLVDTLKPAANEILNTTNQFIRKEIPIIGNMANEAVLMIPGVGQAVGAVEEMGNVAQAGEGAFVALSKLTETGANTYSKLEETKDKASTLWNKISNVWNNGLKYGIDSVKTSVDSLKKRVPSDNDLAKLSENDLHDYYRTHGYGQSGGSLKKYQKEAMMIGGRTDNAKSEFLSPYVNRSQILQQLGGKYHTRRRNRVRRRLTSRRH